MSTSPLTPDLDPARARLEVVATLGPASADPGIIARLGAVAHRFRLNASHLDPAGLERWLQRLAALYQRGACPERPVVVDLQGAKMRLGELEPRPQLCGAVTLCCAERAPADAPEALPVPHPELFAAVRPGERLTLNDARVELRVERVAQERIEATTLRPGPVSARKGLNRPEHPVPFGRLLERDRQAIAVAAAYPFCQLACSFALDGSEAALLRVEAGEAVHLVAKLERPEALTPDHLGALGAAFDELWFCRGDLGSQAGLAALGPLQSRFAAGLAALPVPALLAGQVLHHLTVAPQPTRSEVVHLHDLARAGWAGVVLSDETAVGKHPEAVATLLQTLPDIRPA